MVEGINGIPPAKQIDFQGGLPLVAPARNYRSQAKDEFMAIFYKEILKQALKPPKFGIDEEDISFGSSTMVSDYMFEQMAMELAQAESFSADNFMPQVR
jgi:hypothetical protein